MSATIERKGTARDALHGRERPAGFSRRVALGSSPTLVLLAASGCASIGPATVQRDRLDYISAIGESSKEQILSNVVRLRYDDAPSFADNALLLTTRAIMGQILPEDSSGIDVPPDHVALGRTAVATRLDSAENPRDQPFVRIHSSVSLPPNNSDAAVRYRGTWYWIDDEDLESKRAFSFPMIFFRLQRPGLRRKHPS